MYYCNSGSMGICGIQIQVKKKFIFPLYHINDDAISGNNAVKLSDSETIKALGYAGFPDFSGNIFNISSVYYV